MATLTTEKTSLITGLYNELGYILYEDGVEIHRAGNKTNSNVGSVPTHKGVDLSTIEGYCKFKILRLARNNYAYQEGAIAYEKDLPLVLDEEYRYLEI